MGSPEPSSLGMPSPGNGTIKMGNNLDSTLIYTGSGDTTDRGIDFAGNGNVGLVQNGTGLLKFTGPFTASGDFLHRLSLKGSGNAEIASAVVDAATRVTRIVKSDPGTWTLCGSNTYMGITWIEQGTLALCASGSIDHTSVIRIYSGATFDVSAQPTFTLGYRATLDGRGSGVETGVTASTIIGAPGGVVDVGTRPIDLNYEPEAFLGDTNHPSLYISSGTLNLGGNVFTVFNSSGTPLGAGTYRIIEQASGNVSSLGGHSVSVDGAGVVTGATLSIMVSGGNVNLVVSEAAYVIVWPTASNIVYGQTLADSQLSGGIASVPGTFTFTTPTLVPDAGTANQSVTFTPDDTGLDPETFNVSVTVEKAVPTIDPLPTATAIFFGQSLADSVLSGGVSSVPGTFALTTPMTTPGVGTALQSVTFTPDDPDNYGSVVFDVSVTVEKASAGVFLLDLSQTYDGTPKSITATTSPEGLVVEFTYDGSGTAPTAAGTYAVTGTVNDTSYEGSAIGTLVISKAIPAVTNLPTASNIFVGQSLADSLLIGGAATVPGTFAFTTPLTTPGVGTALQSVTFTPDDSVNYETVVFDVSVTVENIPELSIVTISRVGDDVLVEWPGTNAWFYTMETTTMLLPGDSWIAHADFMDINGTNGTMSAVDIFTEDSVRIYRVRMNK